MLLKHELLLFSKIEFQKNKETTVRSHALLHLALNIYLNVLFEKFREIFDDVNNFHNFSQKEFRQPEEIEFKFKCETKNYHQSIHHSQSEDHSIDRKSFVSLAHKNVHMAPIFKYINHQHSFVLQFKSVLSTNRYSCRQSHVNANVCY